MDHADTRGDGLVIPGIITLSIQRQGFVDRNRPSQVTGDIIIRSGAADQYHIAGRGGINGRIQPCILARAIGIVADSNGLCCQKGRIGQGGNHRNEE